MSERWTWRCDDERGNETGEARGPFPSRADAEAWLGEAWAELADEGVAAVTLRCEDETVYGPMSLSAE